MVILDVELCFVKNRNFFGVSLLISFLFKLLFELFFISGKLVIKKSSFKEKLLLLIFDLL